MAFTLNGIGTRYCGVRWLPDGTYVTTEWVVIFFIPLIPIRSLRVVSEEYTFSALGAGFPFKAQRIPLDIRMVLGLYVRAAISILGLFAVFALLEWLLG